MANNKQQGRDLRSGEAILGLHNGHDFVQLAIIAYVERLNEVLPRGPLLFRVLFDARPLDDRRRIAWQARGQSRQTGPGGIHGGMLANWRGYCYAAHG